MLAGPHPRSLSLGGRPAAGFPPAPRSGRRRFVSVLAGPHPRSLSLGAASLRSRAAGAFSVLAGPHPRSLRARPASLRRLARAAGALFQCSRGPTPARSRSARFAPRSGRRRFSVLAGPHPRSLSLGCFAPAPRSGRRRFSQCSRGPTPARSRSAAPPLPSGASLGPQALCFSARGFRLQPEVTRGISLPPEGGSHMSPGGSHTTPAPRSGRRRFSRLGVDNGQ